MRIVVVAPSPVPFRAGGAERLFDGLVAAINERTEHSADLVKLPSPEHSFVEIIDSYQRFTELDLNHFDLAIVTKYPAWMIEHPNKVLYLLHPLRGLYDAYHFTKEPEIIIDPPQKAAGLIAALDALDQGTGSSVAVLEASHRAVAQLGSDHPLFRFPGPLIRRVVHSLDGAALSPPNTQRHFSISRTVADRDYFPPGVTSGVAYPPSNLTDFRDGGSDYFFTASRLDVPKRIGLIIQAFIEADLDLSLKIAGTGDQLDRLVELAAGDPRIEFLGRVSDRDLVDLYADALAVPFVPYDEDLGLITLEAMHCGTPVITCSDSGGPTELVSHGVNGLIADPDPSSLAAAFQSLGRNPERARAMAPAAHAEARSITWNSVVDTLLGDTVHSTPFSARPATSTTAPATRPPSHDRPHIVVLSTYPFFPSNSGGRIRGARLIAGLAQSFDVEIIVTARQDESADVTMPAPGVTQRLIRLPEAAYRLEQEWTGDVDWIPISDIVPGLLLSSAHAFLEAVSASARGATAIIISHSYLIHALDVVPPSTPILLDAVDLELDQKMRVLPDTDTGTALKRAVEILERSAAVRADLITICSPDDAAAMEEYYETHAPVEVMPNGTDVEGIDFVRHDRRAVNTARWLKRFNDAKGSSFRAMALFLASWHPPNLEAARHILDMAGDARDVVFVLAGSHSRYFEEWRLPPNVVLAGFISDAVKRGLLSSATVALNPMTSGSGTNLKMLEYWAAGVPTISTPFGVRGIDATAGEHYREASLADFPNAVADVVAHSETLDPIAEAARRLVESSYDWNVIGGSFRRLVEAMIARDPGAVHRRGENGTSSPARRTSDTVPG